MIEVTKIAISNDKPIVDTCIIYGVVNNINYKYIAEDQCYYIIYSPHVLNDEQFDSVVYNDDYLDKFF